MCLNKINFKEAERVATEKFQKQEISARGIGYPWLWLALKAVGLSIAAALIKSVLNEGIERNEAGKTRRNKILRNLLSYAKEFGLHLDNLGSPLKRMVG